MGGLGGALIEALECLRDAGVNVALDDFGTGHASLIQLRDVPANIVKIDRSFIARLSESAGNQQVVRATIDLAHSMGNRWWPKGWRMTPSASCSPAGLRSGAGLAVRPAAAVSVDTAGGGVGSILKEHRLSATGLQLCQF